MQYKITIDEEVYEKLKKLGKAMGMSANEYIRMILGKHVLENPPKE